MGIIDVYESYSKTQTLCYVGFRVNRHNVNNMFLFRQLDHCVYYEILVQGQLLRTVVCSYHLNNYKQQH